MTSEGNSGNGESRFVKTVCRNTQSDLIEITEDKLENILLKFLNIFKKVRNWITPFSIFLTFLITILTANFDKNFLSISKEIWCAIFYCGLIGSFIWLLFSVFISIKYKNQGTLEYLLKTIKNN
jgi:hypothetical protein